MVGWAPVRGADIRGAARLERLQCSWESTCAADLQHCLPLKHLQPQGARRQRGRESTCNADLTLLSCQTPPTAGCTAAAQPRIWRCRTSRPACAWCSPSCWPRCAASADDCNAHSLLQSGLQTHVQPLPCALTDPHTSLPHAPISHMVAGRCPWGVNALPAPSTHAQGRSLSCCLSICPPLVRHCSAKSATILRS